MNSIDLQQAEKNYEDLQGSKAAAKIEELAMSTGTCFFCTSIEKGKPFETRPMTVQEVDKEGNLWFLSANDSHLNAQVHTDSSVQLLFQGSSYSDFLELHGTALITSDKERIKKYWKPLLNTWFTEGENDPRITVIKVEFEGGHYWDNKHGNAVALVKMAVGAVLGKTIDDSIQGNLNP